MKLRNILFITLVILVSCIIARGQKKVPMKNQKLLRSTILLDTPRYQPAVKIPTASYGLAYDSVVKYLLPIIGKTLSVDNAEFYKSFLLRQFDVTLIKGYVLDSIAINKPSK